MKSRTAHILLFAFFLLCAVFFLVESLAFDSTADGLSPGSYPFVLAIVFLFFLLLDAWESLSCPRESEGSDVSLTYPLLVVLIIGGFLSFVTYLGFYLSSTLIVFALYLLLEKKNVFRGFIFSGLWALSSYFVFGYVLRVPFPVFGGG